MEKSVGDGQVPFTGSVHNTAGASGHPRKMGRSIAGKTERPAMGRYWIGD